jgi:hypothetical protein
MPALQLGIEADAVVADQDAPPLAPTSIGAFACFARELPRVAEQVLEHDPDQPSIADRRRRLGDHDVDTRPGDRD